VTTPDASSFVRHQAPLFGSLLPTAWSVTLERGIEVEQLAKLVEEFQTLPAKCPQKG
jgi:hypothetical protein